MNAGEHLQDCLERFFQLRQHGDDAVFLTRLARLRAFQRERFLATHRDLFDDPRLRPGIQFLLDDVYGGRDLPPVAREIRRALPKAMRLLPDRVMVTSASALEAAILTQELDEALVHELDNRLDATPELADYTAAYRDAGEEAWRRRQLALVAGLGHHVDRYVRSRAIQTTFRLVRRPAHAAGFTNLYDFMDRSFRVMKPVPSVGRLLERVAEREAVILDRVLADHPAPFKDAR
ncbi:hypothetical protein MLD55_12095 [Alcanivorax sp. MM125-6]|nr:hypothetical protein [Alcanivorax sp. MM125-6]